MTELRSAPFEETAADADADADADQAAAPPALIEAEDLLEEISIDGMCGVY
ncbi:mycofactocin precursor MftA [Streptomyces sp. NBC_00015]|uniref:mycofactocin precursor MftA n=1 Tax=unclassified Streptomyces TaxID=2593676 RepID=UPI002250DC18|nr:mycofactocin precursor MftA [Streptomyces sp. NBC_00103]MCX5374873.1 mycofactocin precursor MftA [Streptomyces sp. NBC_00103]